MSNTRKNTRENRFTLFAKQCKIKYITPNGVIKLYMEKLYVKNFADNLKLLIGDMSVSEFAHKVGLPQQTLSRYLLGQREISLTYLVKIADYFDESIDVLIGRRYHFHSGWMLCPEGELQNTTPFGGWIK